MDKIDYDEKQRLSKKLDMLRERMGQLKYTKDWVPRQNYASIGKAGSVIDKEGNILHLIDSFSETEPELSEDLMFLNNKIDCVIEVLEYLLDNIL